MKTKGAIQRGTGLVLLCGALVCVSAGCGYKALEDSLRDTVRGNTQQSAGSSDETGRAVFFDEPTDPALIEHHAVGDSYMPEIVGSEGLRYTLCGVEAFDSFAASGLALDETMLFDGSTPFYDELLEGQAFILLDFTVTNENTEPPETEPESDYPVVLPFAPLLDAPEADLTGTQALYNSQHPPLDDPRTRRHIFTCRCPRPGKVSIFSMDFWWTGTRWRAGRLCCVWGWLLP